MESLWTYLHDRLGWTSVRENLTYAGMMQLSALMCRWPRPSELARLAKAAGEKPIPYWVLEVELHPPNGEGGHVFWSGFVGSKGSNLTHLTKKYDLLYVWLKAPKLTIYGISKESVYAAAEDDMVRVLNPTVADAVEKKLEDSKLRVDTEWTFYPDPRTDDKITGKAKFRPNKSRPRSKDAPKSLAKPLNPDAPAFTPKQTQSKSKSSSGTRIPIWKDGPEGGQYPLKSM
jgi:hypothetical protein